MTKLEFLLLLQDKLSALPKADMDERLRFYSEMIEDRMEEGLSEEEAVAAVGTVDEIAAQILADFPPVNTARKEVKAKKQQSVWKTVLLVLGSPIWLSLLISALAVMIALYISLWSVIISLWAVFVSVAVCGFCGVVAGIVFALGSHGLTGVAMVGAGIACAGLAVFLCVGCRAATKGTLLLTKKTVKNCFAKKEGA